jgi:hypothetical protein
VCWQVLSHTRKETSYSERILWCSYILFIIIIGGILVLFMYITRLASNEIFSPSNKIHREVGIAIRYGMEGQGNESRWSWGFTGPGTHPTLLYNWYRVTFSGKKRRGVASNTHFPPYVSWAIMAFHRVNLKLGLPRNVKGQPSAKDAKECYINKQRTLRYCCTNIRRSLDKHN